MEESVTKMGQHALVFVGKKILHLEDVTFRQKERERVVIFASHLRRPFPPKTKKTERNKKTGERKTDVA